MKRAQLFVIGGCILLFATAILHATGYDAIGKTIEATGAKPFLINAVKGLWILFSAHLVIVSLITIAVSRTAAGKWLILGCSLFPVFDTFLLLRFVGVFPGSIMIAIAACLFLIGAILFPRNAGID